MIKIIDNKRVEMTNDEYMLYKNISRSYDRPNFNGEDLFRNHFETNDDGIIIFVKPPPNKYTSMEVYCFLTSLMINQHLRISQNQITSLVKEASEKILELISEINTIKEEIKNCKEKTEDVEEKKQKPSNSKKHNKR